jgi:hypothetical protein
MGTSNERWTTFLNTWTSTSSLLKSLKEVVGDMAKLPPLPRDVFRFDGTLEEFKIALAQQGVTEAPAAVFPPLGGLAFPPLGSFVVHEIDRRCWIAPNYRDIEAARAGLIPFAVIGGGMSR